MGIGTLAFISGASKTALSGIQAREEEDRQKRRDELLAKLRMEGDISLKELDRKYDKEDADSKIVSWVQGDGGEQIGLNSAGQERSRRKMTGPELAAAQDAARARALELQNTEVGIADKKDSMRHRRVMEGLESQRVSSERRAGKSGGLDSDAPPGDYERAKELVFQYKDLVDSAVKTNNISPVAVQSAAANIVMNSRTGEEARRNFVDFLGNYASGRKKTDQAKRQNPYAAQ